MDTRHEDKAKFGEVHRSAAKKGTEKPGRGGEERTMISAMAGTSASAVAAAAAAVPLSERYAACPPSRADLLDPDAVKLVPPRCVHAGIHYPRPLFARLARSFFRAIFFGPRGNICGSCEAVDRRRDSVPRTRQVLTFRGSPSPANYACLFLPLPLLSPLLRLPPLRAVAALFPPSVVLPPRAVFLSPSLVTVLLHAPVFIFPSAPFRPYRPASISFILVALVPTSYIPSSVLAHSTFPFQLLSFGNKLNKLNKRILHIFFEIIFTSDNYSLLSSSNFYASPQCFLSIFGS